MGVLPVPKLIRQFAIPSIIAMLVTSLYNIVDQFFIGRCVGTLGNTATNVVYPVTICCIAIALLFGIGAASSFNLAMGAGKKQKAPFYIGNAVAMMFCFGVILGMACLFFKRPILYFLGVPQEAYSYAAQYLGTTAFGFPFVITAAGGAHLVRADGSPNFSMMMNLSGGILNIFLDALFVYVMGMGMFGAALATVIGQILSTVLLVFYLSRFKTVELPLLAFVPRGDVVKRIMSLGASNCFNQVAMMTVAVILNQSLKHYGALSPYGEAIPLACAGIATKLMQIMMAVIIGLAQAMQPIASFNYGAKNFGRVKQALFCALGVGGVVSVISFAIFQLFPGQLVAIFGTGSESYMEFGVLFMRTNYFCIFTYFVQPIISNFFSAIGKPAKGIFLALTRQIIFYLPPLLILPVFFGINGIMYACIFADLMAVLVNVVILRIEFSLDQYKEVPADGK